MPSHAMVLNCCLVKMDDVGSLSCWFLETPKGVVLQYLHSSVGGKMASCSFKSYVCHFLAPVLGQILYFL